MAGQSDSSTPIVASGLGRRFGKSWALRGIDLEVRQKDIVGLVGPDGSGKTTLLQITAAILDPTEGTCRTLGFDTAGESEKVTSRIGYMAQGFALYERLTVAENLSFAAQTRDVPNDVYLKRRERLLAMAGLGPFLDRRESELSGGMRKKLALCANLIHEPPLLLLDEPGLGVDPLSRRELWVMLEDFRQAGATVIFSTSYMDEAEKCDRVVLLKDGSTIAEGSPQELRKQASGSVFSVPSISSELEGRLEADPAVLSIQPRATDLRFILDPNQKAAFLAADTPFRVEPAEPTMEDAFILLSLSGLAREKQPHSTGVHLAPHPRQSTAGPAIHAERLSRRFGSFTAVDEVSFEVSPGEIFGLIGSNGAGKTTLIKMLCGLLPPSEGEATVAGHDISTERRAVRQNIGYMSQRFSLYPDLTVEENLAFFASAYGIARKEAPSRLAWASAVTGLEGIEHRSVNELSAAVRQRLALAASILHRPSILFLDEPTSGVDPLSRSQFWLLIRKLAESGTSVIVTTHFLQETVYCNRMGLMHEGRLVALGSLSYLREGLSGDQEMSAEEVFLGYIEKERVAAAARASVVA